MKINEDRFRTLKWLKDNSISDGGVFQSDAPLAGHIAKDANAFFKIIATKNPSVFVITKPFHDAYELAADRLFDSRLEANIQSQSILFIIPSTGDQILLSIENNTESKKIITEYFQVVNDNIIVAFGQYFLDYGNDTRMESTNAWHSINLKSDPRDNIVNCILLTLFIEYADVQIKYLQPNRQAWDGITCLYNNKSRLPIKIMDSLWYTTLVKSDAFKVRGHFRLQPFGEGHSKRRLVWINEFKKDGYTRKAKILNDIGNS